MSAPQSFRSANPSKDTARAGGGSMSTRFRQSENFREKVAMKKEIDGMANRSIRDILVERRKRKTEDISDIRDDIMRKLAPEFIPEKTIKRIKSAHKAKQTSLPPKPPKEYSAQPELSSKYENCELPKSNTIPFNKPPITVDEMRQTRVSTLGVLPQFRHSTEIEQLRVFMQGSKAPLTIDQKERDGLDEVAEANLPQPGNTPELRDRVSADLDPLDLAGGAHGSPGTPMMLTSRVALVGIFGAIGTVSRAPVTQRAERPPPASTLTEAFKKSQRQKILAERRKGKGTEWDEISEVGSETLSEKSIKSTEELLAEARIISKSQKRLDVPQKSSQSSLKSEESESIKVSASQQQPPVRSVEEIIASLKAVESEGGYSEADRRIDELMNQVLQTTGGSIGPIGEQEQTGQTRPTSNVSDGLDNSRIQSPPSLRSEDQQIEQPKMDLLEQALSEYMGVIGPNEDSQEELDESLNITGRPPDEKDVPVLDLPDTLTEENEVEMTTEEALEILALNPTVTYEDIVAVKGKKLTVKSVPLESSRELTSEKRQKISAAQSITKKDAKSIHAFCNLGPEAFLSESAEVDSDSELTNQELRKLWMLNHVPAKYQKILEKNIARVKVMRSQLRTRPIGSGLSSDTNQSRAKSASAVRDSLLSANSTYSCSTRPLSANQSDLRIAEATDRIMDNLEQWKKTANDKLDNGGEIDAGDLPGLWIEKATLHVDPLSNIWEPAPPKMLATPQLVRSILFPEYQRSFMDDLGDLPSYIGSSDEEEEEKQQLSTRDAVDAEFLAVREKLLSRKYSSIEDLSDHKRDLLSLKKEDCLQTGATVLQSQPNITADTIKTRATKQPIVGESKAVRDLDGNARVSFVTLQERHRRDACRKSLPTVSTVSRTPSQLLIETKIFNEVNRDRESIRYLSLPSLHMYHRDTLIIQSYYEATMEEIQAQKNLVRIKNTQLENSDQEEEEEDDSLEHILQPSDDDNNEVVDPEPQQEEQDAPHSEDEQEIDLDVKPEIVFKKDGLLASCAKDKEVKQTPAEIALEAGRNYVFLPPKKQAHKKKSRHVTMQRRDAIERFLQHKSRHISRRNSFVCLKKGCQDPEEAEILKIPKHVRQGRKSSIPRSFDFETWSKTHGYRGQEDPRDWIVVVWDQWFDEVYPPLTEEQLNESKTDFAEIEPAEDKPSQAQTSVVGVKSGPKLTVPDKPDKTNQRRLSEISSSSSQRAVIVENKLPRKIDVVLNEVEEEKRDEVIKMLKAEALQLTKEMDQADRSNAFYLCRRGAIFRKLGFLSRALDDLNKAIALEPRMHNAYWHRHLIHLLQNKQNAALDDLNYLLKYDKKNQPAYKARAEIYNSLGDTTMAVLNYAQAIKLDPKDHDAYYKRAEIYEQRSEMRLALEDYSQATKIKPDKTEAIFKHSMYYFNTEQWQLAINDFSELVRQDPKNSAARCYRGQALAKLKLWPPAVVDMSAAIHLDPGNADAFYHRGCLLRKAQPQKALKDLSISLILDSSENNVSAFLHRGILYSEMGKPEDAIYDFEAVIELNQEIACAHINLGLIYFNMNFAQRAIKNFTNGIKADTTYVRAYVCRAEAYAAMTDYKNALLDITRAIHLRPDNLHLYMFRGQYVLQTGDLELAAFCVRHAAEMDEKLGNSPTQQALVQTFLKNFDKAIDALTGATRSNPSQELMVLLGKTQMKGERWKEAIITFNKCLDQLRPYNTFLPWPKSAANIYFMIGQCYMEQKHYNEADDSFKLAIKINSKFAEAYYQRGLCRIRLKKGGKGIQDFNLALSLNPNLYQIFLSRACYYGIRGRHSKAILNCNEALKLQPKCVRAYLYRGSLKYHIKAYKLAIEDLGRTTKIDKKCALAYFNRAICQHEAKNYDKALQDYGIVLLLDDLLLQFKALVNRGLLYLSQADFGNSLMDFQLASKQKPKDHRLLHSIAYCHHKLGNLVDSVRAYTKALDLHSGFFEAFIGRGNTFMDFQTEKGRTLAARDYQRVLVCRPDHVIARINLAFCLQVSGKFWQAWNQFTAVLKQYPYNERALEGRAIICLQMSDPTAALQDLDLAVKVKPTAELYNNRGVVHQFIGDRVNAMRDYRKAILIDPNYGLAHYNQGIIYLHSRQFRQALEALSNAVNHLPKDEGARLNRGIARALTKDLEGALEDLEEAIKLSPYSGHAYFNRGHVLASMQKWKLAENDFSKALNLVPDDPYVYKARADCRGNMGLKEKAIDDYKQAVYIASKLRVKMKL